MCDTSARRHATELGIDNRSVRHIVHVELYFHHYKQVIVQQLRTGDYAQRLNFARQMEAIFQANDNLILLMRDEVHFNFSGMINQQNCRYYTLENPRELHKRPLTVLCTVRKVGVIGPDFFEHHTENAVNVTSQRYIEMMIVPELQRKRFPIRRLRLQHEGATAHTARPSMDVLRPLFSDRHHL